MEGIVLFFTLCGVPESVLISVFAEDLHDEDADRTHILVEDEPQNIPMHVTQEELIRIMESPTVYKQMREQADVRNGTCI